MVQVTEAASTAEAEIKAMEAAKIQMAAVARKALTLQVETRLTARKAKTPARTAKPTVRKVTPEMTDPPQTAKMTVHQAVAPVQTAEPRVPMGVQAPANTRGIQHLPLKAPQKAIQRLLPVVNLRQMKVRSLQYLTTPWKP